VRFASRLRRTIASSFARSALLGSAALLTASCATSHAVSAPDGSTAYDVSCFNGRWACDDEARRVCGGGPYVVLDDDATTSVLSKGRNGSLRVQCADDYAATRAPAARVGLSKPEPPSEREFLSACLPLPTRAKQCLNSVYRQDHKKDCASTLGALTDEAKGRLDDALLIVPPDSSVPATETMEL
jgi:hypothetical protein